MTADWRLELTIGGTLTSGTGDHWTIERGDVADPAVVNVLDGLSFAWNMPESLLWPAQIEPVTLAFRLLAPDASLVQGYDRGTRVHALLFAGVENDVGEPIPSIRFDGKLSDLAAIPTPYSNVATGEEYDGITLELVATDVLADLAQTNVRGSFPLQGVGVHEWVGNMFLLGGLDAPEWGTGGDSTEIAARLDGEVPGESVAAAVEALLVAHADGGPLLAADDTDPANHSFYSVFGWRRGIVMPNLDLDGELDEARPYRVEWLAQRNVFTSAGTPNLPGRLAWINTKWRIAFVPPSSSYLEDGVFTPGTQDNGLRIDAGFVDLGARWTRDKRSGVNQVIVTADPEMSAGSPDPWRKVNRARALANGEARSTAQIDNVRVVEQERARHVGDMYLGDPDPVGLIWKSETLVWRASRDPNWPMIRPLFPDSEDTSPWIGGFAAPVVVHNIAAGHSPDGRSHIAGVLGGATWTFNGGEFDIALKILPRLPLPATSVPDTALDWNDAGNVAFVSGNPSLKWNNVDPEMTWGDTRLIRSYASDVADD